MQKASIKIIAGLIIGLAFGYWLGATTTNYQARQNDILNDVIADGEDTPIDDTPVGSSAPGTSLISLEADIVALDQEAGDVARIESAALDRAGWIVIYEQHEGIPGNILGAQRFESGMWSGEVALLRPTVPDMLYYAMIHADDGDRLFDHKKDLPMYDGAGNRIQTTFRTIE